MKTNMMVAVSAIVHLSSPSFYTIEQCEREHEHNMKTGNDRQKVVLT